MKQPIEMLLDGVQWKAIECDTAHQSHSDGLPVATHQGVLTIGGFSLKCYRLDTGQAIIDADDLLQFLVGMGVGQ